MAEIHLSGPDHYAAAETLLTLSAEHGAHQRYEAAAVYAAQAQVHATLAHTAATVFARFGSPVQSGAWGRLLNPSKTSEDNAR